MYRRSPDASATPMSRRHLLALPLLLACATLVGTPPPARAASWLDKIDAAARKLKELKLPTASGPATPPASSSGSAAGAASAASPAAAPGGATPIRSSAAGASVEKTVLGTPPSGALMTVSPHNQHVAWVAPQGSRQGVVVDGVAGPPFDALLPDNRSTVVFSDDGNHYAYLGRVGDEVQFVRDGKVIGKTPYHSRCDYKSLQFGPNSWHAFFVDDTDYNEQGMGGSAHQVVMDGKPGPLGGLDAGGGIAFSPDGKHYAYVVLAIPQRRGSYILLDGERQTAGAGNLQFSRSGQLISVLNTQGSGTVSVDGKVVLKATSVVDVQSSAGGRHLIASVVPSPNAGRVLWADGKIVASPCFANSIVFSQDGKHYAASCEVQSGRNYVLFDGKKGREYLTVKNLQVSADGAHVVYEALMANGAQRFVIVDAQEFGPYRNMIDGNPVALAKTGFHYLFTGSLGVSNEQETVWDGKKVSLPGLWLRRSGTLSENGEHFYGAASKLGTSSSVLLVRDGRPVDGLTLHLIESLHHEPNVPEYAVLSPDGQHIAYASLKSGSHAAGMYIDGRLAQATTVGVQYTAFTPDSRHAYWQLATRPAVLYVDDKPVLKLQVPSPFDRLASGRQLEADGTLQLLAADADGTVIRYRIKP